MQFFESEWTEPFILLDDVVRVFYKQPKWWKMWKLWWICSSGLLFALNDKIDLAPLGVSGNLSPQCVHSGVNLTKIFKLIIIYERKAIATRILRKWVRLIWDWKGFKRGCPRKIRPLNSGQNSDFLQTFCTKQGWYAIKEYLFRLSLLLKNLEIFRQIVVTLETPKTPFRDSENTSVSGTRWQASFSFGNLRFLSTTDIS
jgi:hypothetical protein